ncbi:MAG: hypothetical protein M3Q97_09465, partial [Bacteroidota bacterium]|nr:hypothetical protein [Bacteroidota bacterium]
MRHFLLLVCLLSCSYSRGNNVSISAVEIAGANKISFTLSWENSWSLDGIEVPYNHDAVWVFVKYRS